MSDIDVGRPIYILDVRYIYWTSDIYIGRPIYILDVQYRFWKYWCQLCIGLRYVEPETSFISENLVTFLECDSGTTGKALADKMLLYVRNHLDPIKMRGQAYKRQTELQLEYLLNPLALYTHCTSHCSNLAVVAYFEEVMVRNMIGVL